MLRTTPSLLIAVSFVRENVHFGRCGLFFTRILQVFHPRNSPPFPSAFPLHTVQDLPNVALLLTAHGGHIAFLQDMFPRGEGFMERVFGQFVQAVFKHPKEINKACRIKD